MKKQNLFFRALCIFFAVQMALPSALLAQIVISVPTFPTTNTVHLSLTGAASTNAHVILSTPNLAVPIAAWTRMTTGTVGQTTFNVTKPSNTNAFFAAAIAPIATPTVATPVFTPAGGSYGSPTNVTVTCATPGAAIYYTTNGNTPTTSDNYIFSGGTIYVSGVTTLKAKAFASGYIDSAVATVTYTINAAPFVSAGAQQIIFSSPTTLRGVVRDDGLTGGGIKFTNWTKVSGPGTVTFGNANVTNTTASFSANGIYVLKLAASDGQYTNTSQVTIAYNTTLSVALITPADGSTYTVPTNIILEATASISGGSISSVGFYANGSLIGTATNSPYSFNWQSVPAGNLALTAVANTSDSANTGLASTPANVTVNWPTNVGQVTYALTDLQIPTAGLPITVNRQYNTQYGSTASFGYNGRLDYEAIKISKTASLSSGYTAQISLGQDYIVPNHNTLVIITLDNGEQYGFVPGIVFQAGGQNHIGDGGNTFDAAIRFIFYAAGSTATLDPINAPSDVGMVGYEYYANSHWQGAIFAGYPDIDGQPMGAYEPDFSQFVFTAPDGTKYTFNSDGSVASKTDRNANTLTYSASGITWSNPNTSSSKQISFTRDGNNSITEIYDPIAITQGSTTPAVKYAYDVNGNLTNVARLIQRSPAVYENTGYAYTNANFIYNVTAITDPRGVTSSRYEYDSAGRLTKQCDALGRYTSYIYDTVNHLQVVTDRLNHSTTQRFTPSGQLASVQDANGGVTSYGYDTQGRKIAATNALNQVTAYAYDSNDNLIGSTNEIGGTSGATYNNFGQPLVTLDARNFGTTNIYDSNGNVLFVVDALNVTNAYGYDAQGNRTAETNSFGLPDQSITLNTYNDFGWMTNTATGSFSASYTYDDNGNRLTETKTRTGGNVLTQWQYDAANRQALTIDALNGTNKIFYNGINKQSQTVDAQNRTNKFLYDAVGLLVTNVFADNSVEFFTFDAEGRKLTSTDRSSHTTTYGYDNLGRLTQTTFADNNYTSSSFDAAGRLSRTIATWVIPNGVAPSTTVQEVTRYAYDAAGRRIAATNTLGQGTRFAYDANGNQTNVIDALGRTNTYTFDALNRQTKITFTDATSESYAYDGLSRKVATTNQAGIVTKFGFDTLGRLVAVTNAFGTSQALVTRYVYDEVGNLLQQIDGLNRTNLFTYDALGRRTKETQPGLQAQTFGYDAVGNLTRLTNFNGSVITNQYDALNRLTNKASVNGYKITFAYSPTGQRTNMTDTSGATSYAYDVRDRLQTKITPAGTLTYAYDGFGNLTNIQSATANGVNLLYGYDALNRLTNTVDRFNNSTLYAFDAVGNLQTMQLPNNVTNTYTYDSLNRLTNLVAKSTNGTVASFAYKLAPAGNRTNLVETVNGTSRTNFWIYDPLYRLTNETITATIGGTVSYKYDGVGNRTNRTSSVAGITNQTFVFNSNDQPTNDVFDANGNTRTNSGNVFSYDVENHLTNATVNGTNVLIIYDGDGNRVKKIVGTITNLYLVDDRNPSGYAQVLEEKIIGGGTTNLVRQYAYGLDLISQRDTATTFYGYDGNGNTRYLTATNAAITDTYIYDAFGVVITNTGTSTNFYRYSGEQFDPNLGFVYLRARYLNSAVGRFISRDRLQGNFEDSKSLHRYAYAEVDPINNVDPSGNEIEISIATLNISATLAQISVPAASAAKKSASAVVAAISSKIIYISVDPSGKPSNFDAKAVESLLRTQLAANVFNALPAGQSVRIVVRVEATAPGTLEWVGENNHFYVNRVTWDLHGIPASRDFKGSVQIDPVTVDSWVATTGKNTTAQTWVNILAHEAVFGNPGKHADDNTTPAGDISSGTANALAPYTVTPASRKAIREAFGF
jgi:RHS repeat-associated protein